MARLGWGRRGRGFAWWVVVVGSLEGYVVGFWCLDSRLDQSWVQVNEISELRCYMPAPVGLGWRQLNDLGRCV